MTDASANGAKLMVLPEFSVTGFGFASTNPNDLDTIPGRATAALEKVTRKYNNYVVVGMYERDTVTGVIYNSAALVGPYKFEASSAMVGVLFFVNVAITGSIECGI